jgi:hypothetical protein
MIEFEPDDSVLATIQAEMDAARARDQATYPPS